MCVLHSWDLSVCVKSIMCLSHPLSSHLIIVISTSVKIVNTLSYDSFSLHVFVLSLALSSLCTCFRWKEILARNLSSLLTSTCVFHKIVKSQTAHSVNLSCFWHGWSIGLSILHTLCPERLHTANVATKYVYR